jgi:hypothetical protein
VSLDRVELNPDKVMQGEVWRLVTFLFSPPAVGPIFVIFYFALFYLFGSTLEHYWGTFRYNVFLLIGYLANVAAAFAGAAIMGKQLAPGADPTLQLDSALALNSFLYMSVFLAFARLYPDYILNIFWVLPIRIKWLALLNWIYFAFAFNAGNWVVRMVILATVLNYLIFFGPGYMREIRHGRRRHTFQTTAKKALAAAKHTCVVCGLSSEESPRTLFRYCSKCSGQRCYCPEHIRDHEHVVEEGPAA